MQNPQDWHARYLQQARWTSSVRRFLFQQASRLQLRSVLEVGCGSGVILGELQEYFEAKVFGIDIDLQMLRFARSLNRDFQVGCADGLQLPFPKSAFSITCCHFYLLWVTNPPQAVGEMARVTRPGGYVLAAAEPDYGGRVDYPDELAELGRRQGEALRRQGADPSAGRKIKALFHQAGLRNVRAGVMGGEWGEVPEPGLVDSEWKVLESELGGDLSGLKVIDASAWANGERILYVPTFYAIGQV